MMSEIRKGTRVWSDDYGEGTVVLDLDSVVQVFWDRPLIGTRDHHLLIHDRSFVERLKQLEQ